MATLPIPTTVFSMAPWLHGSMAPWLHGLTCHSATPTEPYYNTLGGTLYPPASRCARQAHSRCTHTCCLLLLLAAAACCRCCCCWLLHFNVHGKQRHARYALASAFSLPHHRPPLTSSSPPPPLPPPPPPEYLHHFNHFPRRPPICFTTPSLPSLLPLLILLSSQSRLPAMLPV
jgi:hypothetical protein